MKDIQLTFHKSDSSNFVGVIKLFNVISAGEIIGDSFAGKYEIKASELCRIGIVVVCNRLLVAAAVVVQSKGKIYGFAAPEKFKSDNPLAFWYGDE